MQGAPRMAHVSARMNRVYVLESFSNKVKFFYLVPFLHNSACFSGRALQPCEAQCKLSASVAAWRIEKSEA